MIAFLVEDKDLNKKFSDYFKFEIRNLNFDKI